MLVIALMIVAGALGATVTAALTPDQRPLKEWAWNVASGAGAAFLVPLFLQTAHSDLMTEMVKPEPNVEVTFLFFAFCLLAGISARRFITNLSDKILNQAAQAEQAAREAKQESQEAKQESKETKSQLNEVREKADMAANIAADATIHGLADTQTDPAVTQETQGIALVEGDENLADPWSGRFGNKAEADGRRLEGTVTAIDNRPGWAAVSLRVVSTDPKRPLKDPVRFYLHPTFRQAKPWVRPVNGVAPLSFISWGAFTVGAQCDKGATHLELDLSTLKDAPSPWKDQ